jgi:hypothetical protein
MVFMTDIEKRLPEQRKKAGHNITFWAKELKVSRSTITRRLQNAGAKKDRGAEYTGPKMRKILPDHFKAIQDVRRWLSLAKIQSYHNDQNGREAVKRYIERLIETGGTTAFWAAMLHRSETTIKKRIKQTGADKGSGAIYTGAEMRKICPDLF